MTDRFVAVGGGHKIATSDDGINWTQRTNGFTATIRCVRYGDDHWVAIDQNNNVGWSNDGITWHVAAGPFNFTNALAYSGNEWIAVDDFGGVFRSTNGISWTTQTTGLPTGGNAELMDVIWDAATHRFYAVGQDFTDNSAIILYSGDGGVTWARHRTAPVHFDFLNAVGSDGAGVLVIAEALGGSSVTQRIAISTDGGLTWTPKTTPFTFSRWANRIVWGSDGSFVAPGSAGELAYSLNDGATWPGATSTFTTSQTIPDAAYGPSLGLWVIVGGGGSLATSADHGATWTAQTSGFSGFLIMGVAFGATSSWSPAVTFTADALLRKTISGSLTADAKFVGATEFVFSTDAVIKRPNTSKSFTGDAMLAWDITGTNDGRNPHDRAELHFGTFPATRVAYDNFTSIEDKLRLAWDRVSTYESGRYIRATFSANAVITTTTRASFRADAVIQ